MPGIEDPKKVADLSVQDRATEAFRAEAPVTFYFASLADSFPAWPSKDRDVQLDKFWKTEPILAGAIYSICTKVAALDFKLTGPRKAVSRYERVLRGADLGSGWLSFVNKTVLDILSQDNGGFVELIRARGAGPTAPVLGVAQLDSQRCYRTGDLEKPVLYTDMEGKDHELKWYQVATLADMPSSREDQRGYGFSVVSRVLSAAQTLRDISIYKRQKLSGKRIPGILFAQGIRRGVIDQALEEAMEQQNQEGMSIYTKPVILASQDPSAPLDAKLVELAGLPDGYDEDTTLKWYIATLAVGFGTDYTEFAPLPGGNLGSATQATIMASRSRGKGPGMILQQFEHLMNWWVLPENVKFEFSSTDPAAEKDRVELSMQRAQMRKVMLDSGEITPEEARVMASQEGDIPNRFLEGGGDPTMDERIEQIVRSCHQMQEAVVKVAQKAQRFGVAL